MHFIFVFDGGMRKPVLTCSSLVSLVHSLLSKDLNVETLFDFRFLSQNIAESDAHHLSSYITINPRWMLRDVSTALSP